MPREHGKRPVVVPGYRTILVRYPSCATGIEVPGTGVSMYVRAILGDNPIEAGYSVDSNGSVGAANGARGSRPNASGAAGQRRMVRR